MSIESRNSYFASPSIGCFICNSPSSDRFPSWICGPKFANLYRFCKTCGLVYQDRPLSDEEVDKYYRDRSKPVERWREYSDKKNIKSARDYEHILKVVGEKSLREVQRVGEIGANDGALLARFRAGGREIIGVEPCKELVQIASSKYGVELSNTVLNDESFGVGSVDLVIGLYVLEHVPNPRETLKIVHEALREGGYLYLEVPSVFEKTTSIQARTHITLFSKNSLSKLIQEHFEILFVGTQAYAGGRNSGLEILAKKTLQIRTPATHPMVDSYAEVCLSACAARIATECKKNLLKVRAKLAALSNNG